MAATAGPAPWVLVAGDFRYTGGMDKANAHLARGLARRGMAVHLVGHSVDAGLAREAGVRVTRVPRPLGGTALGERLLDRAGRTVAGRQRAGGSVVVTNGGNCLWPGVSWMHCVHDAWPCSDAGAPRWFRAKNRLLKRWARRRERLATARARMVMTNSDKTRREVIERLRVPPERVTVVYLGSDEGAFPADAATRTRMRAQLGFTGDAPVLMFVGALGWDDNKGFDRLWAAWRGLASAGWASRLLVVGDGGGRARWAREAARAGCPGLVRFVGASDRVDDLLAAADLLVSPVRYEAYGLAVQEAIVRGVPAVVSASAGIAERYPPAARPLLLERPDAPDSVGAAILRWSGAREHWREVFDAFGATLRRYTWADMVDRIVAVAS
jgi:glycosyltransferase involved in cell wall biosynthesis